MKQSSREEILGRIRKALETKPKGSFNQNAEKLQPYFSTLDEGLALSFARSLNEVNGKFVYCLDRENLIINLKQLAEDEKWDSIFCSDPEMQQYLLDAEIPFSGNDEDFNQMKVALTACEYLIARFGSIMVSAANSGGRKLNVFPPVHLIVAKSPQLVDEIATAMEKIKNKYRNNLPSMITLITGPSRTADIEKTLILGAHGPKELYVFLLESSDV